VSTAIAPDIIATRTRHVQANILQFELISIGLSHKYSILCYRNSYLIDTVTHL